MPLPGSIVQIPTFNPALAVITVISNSATAVVQTESPITFIVGQSVRLIIPKEYGMQEANGLLVNIVATSVPLPNLFRIDLDTRFFSPFVVPANPKQFAQAVPVGERTLQLTGATRNVLGPV